MNIGILTFNFYLGYISILFKNTDLNIYEIVLAT
jgi:hypothetical protein